MPNHHLRLRRLGIDTHQEPVVYMHEDCHVCRAEGFNSYSRVRLETERAALVASVDVVRGDLVAPGEAGLSESAWQNLGAHEGELASVSHAPTLESLSHVRAKIYGHALGEAQLHAILHDVVAGHYTDVEIAALLTACTSAGMNLDEVVGLTRGMVEVGERIHWERTPIADKHCVGGLPGNRTTPIVVAIVASLGVWIPKTSSRAITSPAGTADTMATLTPVDLDLATLRRVVERESGCLAWGGCMRLSPVDDILIRVERALEIDSEAQLVASVLSKKVAAGSTHVLIDVPVGPTAKVRDHTSALALAHLLERVGREVGLEVRTLLSDGRQPVGRGIGPALEAFDVLAVLQNAPDAPADLRERALAIAAALLELVGACAVGRGETEARAVLESGRAWRKFQAICEAQGGLREPPRAAQRWEHLASHAGRLVEIDNRRLARCAKLAGAPNAPAAGIRLLRRLDERIEAGQPLFELFAESAGELAYARSYLDRHPEILRVERA